MLKYLHHFFYPRESNNHRPKILHLSSLFIIVSLLFASTLSLSFVRNTSPKVLGVSSSIPLQELLILTNQQRKENNEPPLTINSNLSSAAEAKARDMFSKDYWAHDAPDGTTPWDFIKKSGYDYVYAGENLARGFSNSSDVINAWMASPEHRSNMLSRNFSEVGLAVEEGNLNGEDTVLIVEELGSKNIIAPSGETKTLAVSDTRENKTEAKSGVKQPAIGVNFSANFIEIFLGIFIGTLVLDLIVVEKKKIIRFTGHNLDHIIFLFIVILCIFFLSQGITL